MNYAQLAFSAAAKELQAKAGSRYSYAQHEKRNTSGLSTAEVEFIQERDSFYLATQGENGFPYIQFRGGPPGFVKALSNHTLAFIEFQGNRQFITQGNLATNSKAALLFMDYVAQARLKLFVEIEIQEADQHAQLYAQLVPQGYAFRPAKIFILHIKGFDWNCPQHITPRYTVTEIEHLLESQNEYITKLKKEIQELKSTTNL